VLTATHWFFPDKEIESVQDALIERASISLNHYFPQSIDDTQGESSSDDLVDVCSCHRDTGLMTFIVVSDEPGLCDYVECVVLTNEVFCSGLQVWDRHHNQWLNIEQLVHSTGQDLFVVAIMGEKIQMYVFVKKPNQLVIDTFAIAGSLAVSNSSQQITEWYDYVKLCICSPS
jgi:hypothetical protein